MDNLKFPVYATPKIDGIRCLKLDGKAVSRSFKPIPNNHIRTTIESMKLDGFDGEVLSGANFSECQSAVMTVEGTPEFTYLIFDYVTDSLTKPYVERMQELENLAIVNSFVKILQPVLCSNLDELKAVMEQHLLDGHEGTMIRLANSSYKCGRSTLKEGHLIAIKYFEDGEAEVYGFEEMMHNDNEKTLDAFGKSERSSHIENLKPANTLGKFLVRSETFGEFKIGTGQGLTQELRKKIWDNQPEYMGKLVHFRYQPHGVKDKPRIPIYHGFRDTRDMSNG